MLPNLIAFVVFATTTALPNTNPSDWIGVWQGDLDGQPGVVLTLAEDNGSLDGTLVLNVVSRDGGQPHIIAHEPHTLVQPRLDGARLSFRVKRMDGSSAPTEFTAELTSPDHARIHCLNCGDDAPTVEMTRLEVHPTR